MKKDRVITILIIILVLIIAFFTLNKSPIETDEKIVKCIGENSILYTQLGCHHCETQKDLFGDNVRNLNIVLCNENWKQCSHISKTPTWEINGELITSVQSFEKIKELTKC